MSRPTKILNNIGPNVHDPNNILIVVGGFLFSKDHLELYVRFNSLGKLGFNFACKMQN